MELEDFALDSDLAIAIERVRQLRGEKRRRGMAQIAEMLGSKEKAESFVAVFDKAMNSPRATRKLFTVKELP